MKKHIINIILVLGYLIIGMGVHAQTPTIGLLFSDVNASDGFTLFSPEQNSSVYLINNCGQKINEWTFSEKPGATCYLLGDGTLLRAGKDSLEIRDWDNNLLWSYPTTANGILQHHDIEPLPNGNILCVASERYTDVEIIAQGRDSTNVAEIFRLDKIIELQPLGINDASIVWEWKVIDHLIQDFDDTKLNFGVVEDHPELIDLNYDNGYVGDWTHVNAVDYNTDLDQIIVTSRHLGELYIIDHSTTTNEAAGHTRGNSNLGGDLLWRWGNPQVYRQNEDQKLFMPHDGKWVEPGYEDEGKISVFNNRSDETNTFSSIHLMTPEIVDGVYLKTDNAFSPVDYEWTWYGSIIGNPVFETNKSGAHSLPNGNFMICQSSLGQYSEITKNGLCLLTYRNPTGTVIYDQFSNDVTTNSIFRAEKYPSNFSGFDGKDLTPQGIIENQNSISDECILTSVSNSPDSKIVLITNPAIGGNINFNQNISLKAVYITDITGRLVFRHGFFNGNKLKINLIPGIYFLQLHSESKIETKKIIVR